MIVTPEKTPDPEDVVVGQQFVLLSYDTIGVSEFGRRQREGVVLWHDRQTDLVALKLKVPPVIQPRDSIGYPIHDKTEGLVWHHRKFLRTRPTSIPANGNDHCFTLSAHRLEKSGLPMMNSVETESFDTLTEAEEHLAGFRAKHQGLPVKVRNTETEEARWYYPKGQESDAEK